MAILMVLLAIMQQQGASKPIWLSFIHTMSCICMHAIKQCYERAILASLKRSQYGKGDTDYVNSMRMMLHCSTLAHAHLLHPIRACDLINQLAKKLITLLAISLVTRVKARSQKRNLLSRWR